VGVDAGWSGSAPGRTSRLVCAAKRQDGKPTLSPALGALVGLDALPKTREWPGTVGSQPDANKECGWMGLKNAGGD
jgi:hypothetical protein